MNTLPLNRHATFVELWYAPAVTIAGIMEAMGYGSRQAVYSMAKALGLDARPTHGAPEATMRAHLTAANERSRLRADSVTEEMEARIDAQLNAPVQAKFWRCRCGGRATSPDGHPACKGKAQPAQGVA